MTALVVVFWLVTLATAADAIRRPQSAWAEADRAKGYWVATILVFNVLGVVAYLVGVVPKFPAGDQANQNPFAKR